jgi:hypothetical protein
MLEQNLNTHLDTTTQCYKTFWTVNFDLMLQCRLFYIFNLLVRQNNTKIEHSIDWHQALPAKIK